MIHFVYLSFRNEMSKFKKWTVRNSNSHLLCFLSEAQEEISSTDKLNSVKVCLMFTVR